LQFLGKVNLVLRDIHLVLLTIAVRFREPVEFRLLGFEFLLIELMFQFASTRSSPGIGFSQSRLIREASESPYRTDPMLYIERHIGLLSRPAIPVQELKRRADPRGAVHPTGNHIQPLLIQAVRQRVDRSLAALFIPLHDGLQDSRIAKAHVSQTLGGGGLCSPNATADILTPLTTKSADR
jgi:hypothetical protein